MLQVCLGCGCRYSAGAPCCPQCRGVEWRPDHEEEGDAVKIAKQGGPTGPGVPDLVQEPVPAAAEPEPAAEPPDPTPGPGPGQGSTLPPSSPASSGQGGEPETPAAPVEPEAAVPAAEVVPEPEPAAPPAPKPAPSLSRAKDVPAEITGSGGVVLPKLETSVA